MARELITLAIDPGPEQSALVLWNGRSVMYKQKANNDYLLEYIQSSNVHFECVCEQIASYGMPVGKEVFATCFWTGRFWQQCIHNGYPFYLVPRKRVTAHICQSNKASDSNVRTALIDRFGVPGTKNNPGLTYGLKADLWAAFALAVTFRDLPELKIGHSVD